MMARILLLTITSTLLLLCGCTGTKVHKNKELTLVNKELTLVSEAGLPKLLQNVCSKKDLEASGVIFARNAYYVVFDNCSKIAKIDTNLKKTELLGQEEQGIGYEGITYSQINNREEFYLVEESVKNDNVFNARLNVANGEFILESKKWLEYTFKSDNKGFEGVTVVAKDGKVYILALCEGNGCKAGKKSTTPGAGTIKVFEKTPNEWKDLASIELPETLEFVDYSGIAINDDSMVAITSQESSALWVGKLDILSWKIENDGIAYDLPKNTDGKTVYCNIEGVSWVTENKVVIVSDARKGKQKKRCKTKEQSIHIMSM